VTTQADAHRIDISSSSAHVVIGRDGVVLADTTRPVLLKEGKLPTRYYIPHEDVRVELQPTETTSHCPFKGDASYWSATVAGESLPDIAWTYEQPIPSAEQIAGLVCFYNEKVDIEVDGEALERPKTHWS
jgi:uncharacterized protein (DUF427 family)